jgi:phosphatidylserine/phosphatidylglycerophosphate/cardiolipin synthase-like enzyme
MSSRDEEAPSPPQKDAITPIKVIEPVVSIQPIDAPKPTVPPPRRSSRRSDPFFLKEVASRDPLEARGAVTDVSAVEPIVDGEGIFAAMEDAIRQARWSILIAFWFFHPAMPLRKTSAQGSAKTWLELLVEAAKRGVRIRVLFGDFDPLFFWKEHRHAWGSYFEIVRAIKAENLSQESFQVACWRHGLNIPEKTSAAFLMIKSYAQVVQLLNGLKSNDQRQKHFDSAPGIWDRIELDKSLKSASLIGTLKSFPVHPASHHQKLLIVDGTRAFTGGLNIGTAYPDSRKHDQLTKPWHDLFVKVEGEAILADFISNYIGLWNLARIDCETFLTAALKARRGPSPREPLSVGATTPLDTSIVPAQPSTTTPGRIPAQVRRTITKDGGDALGQPKVLRRDVLEGYIAAIKQAEQFIYFENQYYREEAIYKAIYERRVKQRNLKVIMLLPKVVEEADGVQPDMLTNHGIFLQFKLLRDLQQKLKGDVGLFSMEEGGADPRQVYVHSKLLIVDDSLASIGSANANPRSLQLDTELDFVWRDATTIRNLRLDLWNEILGNPPDIAKWKPKDFVKKWEEAAKNRLGQDPAARKGFVIRYSNLLEGEDFKEAVKNATKGLIDNVPIDVSIYT